LGREGDLDEFELVELLNLALLQPELVSKACHWKTEDVLFAVELDDVDKLLWVEPRVDGQQGHIAKDR